MPAVNPQQLQEALIAAASRVAAATGQQPPQIDGACSLESFPAALSAAAGGQQQLLTEEERFNQLLQQVKFINMRALLASLDLNFQILSHISVFNAPVPE